MSTINPLDPYGGTTPPIEQQLGTAYDNVRRVAQIVPSVVTVSGNIDEVIEAAKLNEDLPALKEQMSTAHVDSLAAIEAALPAAASAQEAKDAEIHLTGFEDRLKGEEGGGMVGVAVGTAEVASVDEVTPIHTLQAFGATTVTTQAQLVAALAGNGIELIQSDSLGTDFKQGHMGKKVTSTQSFKMRDSVTGKEHVQVMPGITIPNSYQFDDYSCFSSMSPTVMSYGDSNTAFVDENGRVGLGQGSWRSYLEIQLSKYVYYNSSRVRGDGSPGQTSKYALDNFDLFMSTYAPKITILGWGTNDLAQGVISRDQYIQNMAKLIEQFKMAGVLPIVLGIPWHHTLFDDVLAWNSSLKKLCDDYDVEFIPVYTLFSVAPSVYFANDGVHYTVDANKILAEKLVAAIVKRYKLPDTKMAVSQVNPNKLRTGSLTSSGCKTVSVVQTPDTALRRMFPWCLQIPIGVEVQFSNSGPFGAIFSWPDSKDASWVLNGSPYTPTTIGGVVRIMSVDSRLNGSAGSFRMSSSAGAPLYLLCTLQEYSDSGDVPVISSLVARNVAVVAGQLYQVNDGVGKVVTTIFSPVTGAEKPTGYAPNSAIPNAGPRTVRTAITAAPEGFLFVETDNQLWFKWASGAWVAVP